MVNKVARRSLVWEPVYVEGTFSGVELLGHKVYVTLILVLSTGVHHQSSTPGSHDLTNSNLWVFSQSDR